MKGRVSEKGQVTIPKRLRDRLGIRAGEVLEFSEDRGRLVATKRSERDPVDGVYGILGSEVRASDLIEELRGRPDAV